MVCMIRTTLSRLSWWWEVIRQLRRLLTVAGLAVTALVSFSLPVIADGATVAVTGHPGAGQSAAIAAAGIVLSVAAAIIGPVLIRRHKRAAWEARYGAAWDLWRRLYGPAAENQPYGRYRPPQPPAGSRRRRGTAVPDRAQGPAAGDHVSRETGRPAAERPAPARPDHDMPGPAGFRETRQPPDAHDRGTP